MPPTMNEKWPDPLSPPNPARVQTLLSDFWRTLGVLPELLISDEHLLAERKTADLRFIAIEMMLALNGISQPTNTRHLNLYLSQRQKAALEKTLLAPASTRATWISRAVALVVIYRWYAPQLVEKFGMTYPAAEEQQAWHHLQQIPEWPRSITTEEESKTSA